MGGSKLDWLDAAMALWAVGLTILVLAGLAYTLLYVRHVESDLEALRDRLIRYEDNLDKDRRMRDALRDQEQQLKRLRGD